MKSLDTQEAVSFLKNNFITYRSKWAKQNADGSYYTGTSYSLNDKMLQQHIEGKETFAIYVNKISKFLAFDVDCYTDDEAVRKMAVYNVMNTLIEMGIPYECLNIFYSGNKGYHVVIFFDKPVKSESVKQFFQAVEIVGGFKDMDKVNIELRGGNGQAYKLPFAVHKVTKKRAWAIDKETMKPLEYEIPEVQCVDSSEFYMLKNEALERLEVIEILNLNKVQQITSQRAVASSKALPEGKTIEDVKADIEANRNTLNQVLEAGMLIEKGTRNDVIFLLALYYNGSNYPKELARASAKEIMKNTPDSLFNDKSSLEWKVKQCNIVIDKVYKNNMRLAGFTAEAYFTKEEMIYILKSCKTFKQMQLLLMFFIYSKQFKNAEGQFFLSQKTIEKVLGIEQPNASEMIKKLIRMGLIELVQKGYYVICEGEKLGIASTYKVPFEQEHGQVEDVEGVEDDDEEEKKIKIKTADELAFITAVQSLIPEDELKQIITKNLFYKTFKPLLTK